MIRYSPVSVYDAAFTIWSECWASAKESTDADASVVLVASGADGIRIALQALRAKNRNVVVPGYTCDRVVSAVIAAGAFPYFVDINLSTGEFDDAQLLEALGLVPAAIIATHLFGAYVGIERLIKLANKTGVAVIEDCALYLHDIADPMPTTKAAFAIYSFGRGKPWSFGGGGAVVGNSVLINDIHKSKPSAQELRQLSLSGIVCGVIRDSYSALFCQELISRLKKVNVHPIPAPWPEITVLRASNVSSGVARYLKRCIDNWSHRQLPNYTQDALNLYRLAFSKNGIEVPGGIGFRLSANSATPALALLTVDRNEIVSRLRVCGIDCPQYWGYSAAIRGGKLDCMNSVRLSEQLLFLPMHKHVTSAGAEKVASVVRSFELTAFN